MNLSSNNLATSTPIKTATTTSTTEYPYAQGSGTPPPGSTTKFPTAADDKKSRRTSLQVLLPKLPSSDSLSNSPGPASPGLSNWNDNSPKVEGSILDKTSDASKLNRKESYKAQRKNYRREKKRVASELLNSLQDPAVIVLADWLKVRGTLKSWTKLWCVLKPGLLFLYKSPKTKSSHWVGTILLTSCQAIERPSKKDGFCFKLFHPLDQSIWAPRGPDKETIGAVIQPLPTSYLIFRAPSQAAGKCWMDALELSLRCSALLLRSASGGNSSEGATHSGRISHETQWSEADYEKHFDEHATAKHGKPSFLAKYIPATPPEKHCFAPNSDPKYFPRSPCPSPTPIFQQLYLAMGQWERILTDSPENVEVLKKKCNYAMNSINKNINKHPMNNDNENTDETDDERSINGSPNKYELKKTSSLNILLDDERLSKKLRRKSMPAEFIESVKKPVKKHFHLQKVVNKKYLDVDSQIDGGNMIMSGPETDSESDVPDGQEDEFPETPYVHCHEDEFGAAGEQVEELAEEHKSLIWFLVKQVRPGMDLSKVVLPTFILEPRSFLDKLSDSYYHADLLSKAVLEDDPFTRMKTVVQWYLSGFYKKPKGLKKPYNPILGETFRCYWEHPNGSRTFYIAEQVSHHPPVSAFYVTNRQDGFCISCSILAKSKFYGNSTSAVLNGTATLTLLPRGESYSLTVPYAHCKGILMGTLSMELGGKISIECENTGYRTELEFKLKPFLGGAEYTNVVSGRLKLGKETLASINGHWDSVIKIKDSRTGEESVLFTPSQEIRSKRLKRFSVPIESQANNESERLWQHVSAAIHRDDQVAATEEKTALEEAQREAAKERKATCTDWVPVHFQQDLVYGQWHYKYADLRPWDPRNDLRQYESNYRIQTKTRHQAPMVRTASIVSTEPLSILQAESRQSLAALKNSKRVLSTRKMSLGSTPDPAEHNSDSSQSDVNTSRRSSKILHSLENINKKLEEHSQKLATMQLKLERIAYAPKNDVTTNISLQNVVFIIVGIFIYAFLSWLLPKK